MDAGHVWQVDSYRNLLTWPVNLRVAVFVAESGSQFIDGAFEEGRFVCAAFSLPVLPAVAVRATPGGALVLRVRPTAVHLASDERPNWPQAAVAVEWIEPLPLQRIQRAYCRTGAVTLAVDLHQDKPVRDGETLHLQIDPDQVQVFDTRSGVNLALTAPH
jgi:multiple sugar transport system ATP-binding protein